MSSPTVSLSWPSSSLFRFPPSNDPRVLPPQQAGSTLSAPPFSIPSSLYISALNVKVPITIASIYAVTVVSLNAYNRSGGNKPWRISKTRAFFCFVVLHNVFLAVYSAWTFVGMLGALRTTVQRPSGPAGFAGTVDSLCKIHGVSGLGNAIAYNGSESKWISQSPSTILLTGAGAPDSTDVGRLWNEGLAFYGWFFYLSKFYEVLDTAIILAKGKRSSTLQTYHHAGAMMCMWAGIRYMSPPIWMFVFVNSAIHTLMYTYYTLTAFSVPIPNTLKRSLTTMQIIQFLVGVAYAAFHSFVSYSIPVRVPYLKDAISVTANATSSAAATATAASVMDIIKKLLFRAVGGEGVAENVNAAHTPGIIEQTNSLAGTAQYRTEYQTVPCIDTNGQTFAIWLNVFYLAPLTFLFGRFFVKSYLRRSDKMTSHASGNVEKAGIDAVKGVERSFNGGLANGGKMNGNGKANGKH
ncbi:Elongation of very long chain fatty acids protein [Lachnellula hyalina]|uniref:Elongation of fatty acids protein n=1 Tax=Lachnellula hyalina TaxID=1316788 RepID=A0A8H8R167_9HELO|nr:Elongation of very long chain fatty acids protein [Lachnellula hyalina]TVY25880.1 Elongation of very long chain fatty acids protein [Lachnellula hyalina]